MAPGDDKPTMRLDSRDVKVSWPLLISTLEQIGPWAVHAFRLGALTLIQECINEAKERDAGPSVVPRMRELVEALAKLPWAGTD